MLEGPEFIEPLRLRASAEQLARRWSPARLRFVRDFDNAVYEFGTSPRRYLRVTQATHRSCDEIASELDFARFLGGQGIAIAQPVPAQDGSLICTAELDGRELIACAFEEAPGLAYEDCPDLDRASFFFNAGRLMAEIHEAGRRYRPGSNSNFARFAWREDRWQSFPEVVPWTEVEAWSLYEKLMAWTSSLPTDSATFGLIHGDCTIANLRIQQGQQNQQSQQNRQGRLTLFDLDSCCAHWHAYEIASFLHYFGASLELRELAYDRVLPGYAEVRPTDPQVLEQIPQFAKLRLLYSYLVFAQRWGFEDLSEEQVAYFDRRRTLFAAGPVWPP